MTLTFSILLALRIIYRPLVSFNEKHNDSKPDVLDKILFFTTCSNLPERMTPWKSLTYCSLTDKLALVENMSPSLTLQREPQCCRTVNKLQMLNTNFEFSFTDKTWD